MLNGNGDLYADQAAGLRAMNAQSFRGVSLSTARCVAIGSGKGGVGKTVVSVGLSLALCELKHRVLLFDGDMGLANVDLQMGLVPEFTVQDVIFGHCPMEKACIHVDGGLDVLVSASGSADLADLSSARRRLFIEELFRFAANYDFFLIDTGAGIGGVSTDFLAACPEVLVVLTNEPTSLMDAYALIKTLHLRGEVKGLGVIVNMVDSVEEGERVFGRLNDITRQFLGLTLQLDEVLIYDRRVSDSIRRQQSILHYAGSGAVANSLRELAGRLAKRPRQLSSPPNLEQWMRQWELSAFLSNGLDAGKL